MTGHIVFSTLHTNTSAGALPRLLDIGVEPYLIASTINAVMAQRLVRMICAECKTEYHLDDIAIEGLKKQFHLEKILPVLEKEKVIPAKTKNLQDVKFYKGKGCDKCNHTGYKGRLGIHEILEMTPEVSEMVMQHKSTQEIEVTSESQGMLFMWEDGFIKAAKGVTTVDEIVRVSKE